MPMLLQLCSFLVPVVKQSSENSHETHGNADCGLHWRELATKPCQYQPLSNFLAMNPNSHTNSPKILSNLLWEIEGRNNSTQQVHMNQISCRLPSSVPLHTSSYKEVKSNEHEILGAGDTLGMLEFWRVRPITLSPRKFAQIPGKQSPSVSARCSLKHGRWSSLNFFSWDTFWSLLLRADKIKSQEEIRRDKIDLKTLTQREPTIKHQAFLDDLKPTKTKVSRVRFCLWEWMLCHPGGFIVRGFASIQCLSWRRQSLSQNI